MKLFFLAALLAGVALVLGADLHGTVALDYNGVRALAAQILTGMKS
ncbi:MAG: hypothetical protein OEL88_15560 [Sterolibacteriaceae bacterium MAG5]|nr:hypothetical protein [Candidatus Nitricoxidireducens bremensis]